MIAIFQDSLVCLITQEKNVVIGQLFALELAILIAIGLYDFALLIQQVLIKLLILFKKLRFILLIQDLILVVVEHSFVEGRCTHVHVYASMLLLCLLGIIVLGAA